MLGKAPPFGIELALTVAGLLACGLTLANTVADGTEKSGPTAPAGGRSLTIHCPFDEIARDEFRLEDGEPTFGLLSQISPDGKWVVSTVKDKLAENHARAGRFADAVRSAEHALQLARAAGKRDQAERITTRLSRYRTAAVDAPP